jgi:tRNA(fMet)-specific endonuclease VapC
VNFEYMLDTDTVSFALRGEGEVGKRLLEHRPSQLCISAMTLAELRYGAERRKSAKISAAIDTFVGNIAAVPFDDASAMEYGRLAGAFAAKGSPIGEFDVLIAAHAISLDLTLITNNLRHFMRVPGLRTENWYRH